MAILEGLYPERESKNGLKPSLAPPVSTAPAARNAPAESVAPLLPLAPLVPAVPTPPVAEISVTLPGGTDPTALAQAAAAAAAAATAAAAAATAAAQAAATAAQAAATAAAKCDQARLSASPPALAPAPEAAPLLAPTQLRSIPREEEKPIAIVQEAPSPAQVKESPIPQPEPAVQAAPAPQPVTTSQVCIEHIRVSDLPEFARFASAHPEDYSVLPISPMRADAQARNPLAAPDDVGLIVGYVGDRCAGYLGLLPGAIEFRDRRHPVSCLSGFYVAPGDRTSGLVTRLPLEAMGLGRDLYATRINNEARDLFTQLGFWPAQSQRVLRLRLSRFKKLKGIPLRALVRSVSGGADVKDAWHLVTEARTPMTAVWTDRPQLTAGAPARNGKPAKKKSANGVAAGLAGALSPSDRPRFVRDEGVINWMVRHPWIGEDSHAPLPYALPYRREMFRYLVFEASQGGYVVLNVTQDRHSATLRILDRRPMTPETLGPALARALVEAQRIVADVVECPAEYEPLLRSTFAGRVLMAADERGSLVYTRDQNGPFGKYLDAMDWSGFEGDAPYY